MTLVDGGLVARVLSPLYFSRLADHARVVSEPATPPRSRSHSIKASKKQKGFNPSQTKSMSEFELEELSSFRSTSSMLEEEDVLSSPRNMWRRWFLGVVESYRTKVVANASIIEPDALPRPLFSQFQPNTFSPVWTPSLNTSASKTKLARSPLGFWPDNPFQSSFQKVDSMDALSLMHRGSAFLVLPSSSFFSAYAKGPPVTQLCTLKLSSDNKMLLVLQANAVEGSRDYLEQIPLTSINWITNGVVSREMGNFVPAQLAMCAFSVNFRGFLFCCV